MNKKGKDIQDRGSTGEDWLLHVQTAHALAGQTGSTGPSSLLCTWRCCCALTPPLSTRRLKILNKKLKNLLLVLPMHWFRKRKAGKEVGNEAGGAGTGVTKDLKEKDCSFLYGAGEVILKQELWEVSGQFLATAVTCSSRREVAAVEEWAGIGVCHHGWCHSSDKGVGSLFP